MPMVFSTYRSRPGIEGGLRISYATLVLYEISKESLPKNQPKISLIKNMVFKQTKLF
jgi:hypothetical protein